MYEVTIETKAEPNKKTRSFRSTCLGALEASYLCDFSTSQNEIKPVWAMFVGSENELRPFMFNLLAGHKAIIDKGSYSRIKERLVFPKSANYKVFWQKEEEATIATIYLSDFFMLDPGMIEPEGAKFIVLPSIEWCNNQSIEAAPILSYIKAITHKELLDKEELSEANLTKLIHIAFLFCAYLDRRTRCPLVADGKFYLQILIAALTQGLAFLPKDSNKYVPYGTKAFGIGYGSLEGPALETLGLAGGISFQADHIQIEALLAKEVEIYFKNKCT
jgi:hypothetical protein